MAMEKQPLRPEPGQIGTPAPTPDNQGDTKSFYNPEPGHMGTPAPTPDNRDTPPLYHPEPGQIGTPAPTPDNQGAAGSFYNPEPGQMGTPAPTPENQDIPPLYPLEPGQVGTPAPTPDNRVGMGLPTEEPLTQWDGPSDHTLKEIVGEALARVDGILGLKGGLGDLFKKDEDLTRGIKVHVMNQNTVDVSAKVITEAGYDLDLLLAEATGNILSALEDRGFSSGAIEVEAADVMTLDEFHNKYNAGRAI